MENIFNTANGFIAQSDQQHCFFLHFKGAEIKLPPCSLIALKAKINSYNIEHLLLTDEETSDLEIIPVCNREHFLILSLEDLIELKELISGTFVMFELNSIVSV